MTNTKRHSLRRLAGLGLLAAALPLALPALAQGNWPTKPVKMVVPFAAGGSTDVVARLLGQQLGEMWGQPVVIETRPGAGGNVGADAVVKSPADGYTLLMASGSITINPPLYGARMPFDVKRDLVPISIVASGPQLVVVQDASPFKTLRDLIAAAKAKPGALSFGSAGVGSQVHLAGENFAYAAGVDMLHVPYRGEAAAYPDVISGQTQMMVGNIAAASALLGPGRLRALAITSAKRSPLMPDLPTVAESGLPGFENIGWFGLLAPAGTPQAVVDKIQRDTAKALAETQIKARLFVLGMTPVGSTQAEFAKTIDQELVRWAEVIRARKITIQ
jgi:tripartite-type tricarboxylate transporter receptor subunit TctC